MTAHMKSCATRDNQDGVVMVMIPIILLLVGLLVAYMTRSVGGPDFYKEQVTREKMDEIAVAVSSYVQRYNRLPCPAQPDNGGPEPFGFEEGSGANGANMIAAGTQCATREGIVPVHTLGLTLDYLRDDWGNYFTYVVSRQFTYVPNIGRYADGPGGIDNLPFRDGAVGIHNMCRSSGAPGSGSWIETGRVNYVAKDGVTYPFTGAPINVAVNPFKATFCCIGQLPFNDITVNVNGNVTPSRSLNPADYGVADNTVTTADTQAEAVAFILLSHGANGWGAFAVNGTNNKLGRFGGPNVALSVNEVENLDNDLEFVDVPKTLGNNPAGYYDDIIMHFTQNQIYGHLGNTDCRTPF
jgi:hypothetical protein